MKKLLLIAFTALSIQIIAQTNTFPSSGNVGIGTISPRAKLDVNGDAYINKLFTTDNNAIDPLNPYSADIVIGSDAGSRHNSSMMFWSDGSASRISGRNDVFSFSVWNTTNPNVSLAATVGAASFIQGSLGIGTTNPAYKLDVAGELKAEGIQLVAYSPILFSAGDINHGIRYAGSYSNFANTLLDGPVMYGYSGGALGIKQGNTEAIALRWTGVGNVGIGTTNPAYKLDVLGTIRAKEVLVNLDGGADFVFEKGYKLLSIEHVANYVQENKHLPDMPSTNEMVKNGTNMGELQVKLLQKVEEQTLYIIRLNNELQDLKKQLKELQNKK